MQTERVTFLTSPDQKAKLDAYAALHGHSVGHVLREASSRYIADGPADEEAELAALVAEVNKAIPKMNAALDVMNRKLDRLSDDVKGLNTYAGAIDRRVVRIETMIEMSARNGDQPCIEG